MSLLPSIADSGLALVARADRRLAESARGFTRIAGGPGVEAPAAAERRAGGAATAANAAGAAGGAADGATAGGDALVDAALGVVYGRGMGAIGVKLLEVGRDAEQALVDVLA